MDESLWNIIYLFGLVLGLFLAVVLYFQRHANWLAARLLAAGVALIALAILAELVQADLAPRWALLLACLNINTELAFGPLAYLLVRTVLYPEQGWRSANWAHFLPMVAGLGIWTLLWAQLDDPSSVYFAGLSSVAPVKAFLGLKATILFSYLGASLVTLNRALGSGRRYSRGRRPIDLRRMRTWLWALSLIPATAYLAAFAEGLDVEWRIESDVVSGLLLTGLVFTILTLLLLRPGLLSIEARAERHGEASRDARQLISRLEHDQPWKDAELTLAQLAADMGWSENQLSKLINDELGIGFYALLSGYRLAEFERLARDPGMKDCSVLELALEAGFNSKASFYRAFGRRHGPTTPTAFRQSVASS